MIGLTENLKGYKQRNIGLHAVPSSTMKHYIERELIPKEIPNEKPLI